MSAGRCLEVSLEGIARDLNTLGIAYSVLESGAEGALLVVPECGRILGLWPHWRGENALWVDPDFLDQLRIGVKDDGWRNPGGDGLCLAPEAEFLEDGRTPPASVDPGRYERLPEKGQWTMENRGEALGWQSGMRIGFRIQRRIRPLDEKALAGMWGTTYLRQAGYEEESSVELTAGPPFAAGLRSLTCVMAGGEARIPLRKYWGDTRLAARPSGEIDLADACAVVGLRRERAIRADLDATEARPRIMYALEREQGRAILLVRDFERAGGCPGEPFIRCSTADGKEGAGELACFSRSCAGIGASRGGPDSGKVVWKTSLCAFSGRAVEIKALAKRLAL
jgi:hypothetical protein